MKVRLLCGPGLGHFAALTFAYSRMPLAMTPSVQSSCPEMWRAFSISFACRTVTKRCPWIRPLTSEPGTPVTGRRQLVRARLERPCVIERGQFLSREASEEYPALIFWQQSKAGGGGLHQASSAGATIPAGVAVLLSFDLVRIILCG